MWVPVGRGGGGQVAYPGVDVVPRAGEVERGGETDAGAGTGNEGDRHETLPGRGAGYGEPLGDAA